MMNCAAPIARAAVSPLPEARTQSDDPILALISEHRECNKAYAAQGEIIAALAERLPRGKRTWSYVKGEPLPPDGCTDDAGWLAAQVREGQLAVRTDAIAMQMLETEPTTLAGIIALFQYVTEVNAAGETFPDSVQMKTPTSYTWTNEMGVAFEVALVEHMASVLGKMNAAPGEPDGASKASEDAETVRLYRDLEPMICDMHRMARVVSGLVEDALGSDHSSTTGSEMLRYISPAECEDMIFIAYKAQEMASALQDAYYAEPDDTAGGRKS